MHGHMKAATMISGQLVSAGLGDQYRLLWGATSGLTLPARLMSWQSRAQQRWCRRAADQQLQTGHRDGWPSGEGAHGEESGWFVWGT